MPQSMSARAVRRYIEAEWRRVAGNQARLHEPPKGFSETILRLSRTHPNGQSISLAEIRACYDRVAHQCEWLQIQSVDHDAAQTMFIAEAIERFGAKRVLDGGCGVGLSLGFLAAHFSRVRFQGYDVSPRCIERAQERLGRLRCTNASVMVGDHAGIVEHVKSASVDLFFVKNAFGAGKGSIKNPESPAWEQWLSTNSDCVERRRWFACFATLLRPNGICLILQQTSAWEHAALTTMAKNEGLQELPLFRRIFPYEAKRRCLAELCAQFGEETAVEIATENGLLIQPFTDAILFSKQP